MERRILVIGGGAIGSLVAAQLAQAGRPVTLVGRPRTVAAINRRGLLLSVQGQETPAHGVEACASLAQAFAGRQNYGLAVLAVKSYDTEQAAAELRAAAPGASLPAVLTLQNGVGNEEALAAVVDARRVIAGVITTPATTPEPGHVAVERPSHWVGLADLIGAGSTDSAASDLVTAAQAADLLAGCGFTVRTYADWRSLKWTKLAMNLLANASCALLGWPPEQVWADRRLALLEIAAWREALLVLRSLGCRLVNLGRYPLAWVEWPLRSLPTAILRPVMGRFVVRGRGGKMPSLYLDLAQGKGRSEVGWLNGAVVAAGRPLGVATPANKALYGALAAVVAGREPWPRYRNRPQALLDPWRGAGEPAARSGGEGQDEEQPNQGDGGEFQDHAAGQAL